MGVHHPNQKTQERKTLSVPLSKQDSQQKELSYVQRLHQLQATALLVPVVRTPQQCEDAELLKAVQRGVQIACEVQSHEAGTRREERPAQLSTVTITTIQSRAEGPQVVYSLQLSCTEQNEVFCARDNDDNRLVVFVDDGSEVTLIRQSAVSKD